MRCLPAGGRLPGPIFSSLAVVSIGIASFVAATTFSDSLRAVIDRPSLHGVTWDDVITTQDDAFLEDPQGQEHLSAHIGKALAEDPDIEAIASVDSGAPTRVFSPDGPAEGIAVLGLAVINLKGSLFAPIVEGHPPSAPDEVVLGARMIRALNPRIRPRSRSRSKAQATAASRSGWSGAR